MDTKINEAASRHLPIKKKGGLRTQPTVSILGAYFVYMYRVYGTFGQSLVIFDRIHSYLRKQIGVRLVGISQQNTPTSWKCGELPIQCIAWTTRVQIESGCQSITPNSKQK